MVFLRWQPILLAPFSQNSFLEVVALQSLRRTSVNDLEISILKYGQVQAITLRGSVVFGFSSTAGAREWRISFG
jgi:hypothetical protein